MANLRNKQRDSGSPKVKRSSRKPKFVMCYKCNQKFDDVGVYEWHKSEHIVKKNKKESESIRIRDEKQLEITPDKMLVIHEPISTEMDVSFEKIDSTILPSDISANKSKAAIATYSKENNNIDGLLLNSSLTFPEKVFESYESIQEVTEKICTNNEIMVNPTDEYPEENPRLVIAEHSQNIEETDIEYSDPEVIPKPKTIPEGIPISNNRKKLELCGLMMPTLEQSPEVLKKETSKTQNEFITFTTTMGTVQKEINPDMFGTGTHRFVRKLHYCISSISQPIRKRQEVRNIVQNYSYFL